MSEHAQGEHWVDLAEAAEQLGVSIGTIRRRIKMGLLAARRLPTPKGFRWVVRLDAGAAPAVPPWATPHGLPHALDALDRLVRELEARAEQRSDRVTLLRREWQATAHRTIWDAEARSPSGTLCDWPTPREPLPVSAAS